MGGTSPCPPDTFRRQKKRTSRLFRQVLDLPSGAGRLRTDYLLNAIQALSQLSYSPGLPLSAATISPTQPVMTVYPICGRLSSPFDSRPRRNTSFQSTAHSPTFHASGCRPYLRLQPPGDIERRGFHRYRPAGLSTGRAENGVF